MHIKRLPVKAMVFLAVMMLAAVVLPVKTFAYLDVNGFEIEDGVLVDYLGAGGAVVIPDGVTEIGDWVFSGNQYITSVSIPGSVSSIGKGAFDDCVNLAEIELGEGIKTIKEFAFQDAHELLEVTIPKSVESVGEGAFSSCPKLVKAEFLNPKTVFYKPKGSTSGADTVFWARTAIDFYPTKTKNVVIYGYMGSTAESHAKNSGIPFEPIDASGSTVAPEIIEALLAARGDGAIDLYVGKSATIPLPGGVRASDVTFTLSEGGAEIAAVSAAGKITAKGVGVVTVTVKKGGEEIKSLVYACYVPVKKITLTYDKDAAKYLYIGSELYVTITTTPANATFADYFCYEYSPLIDPDEDGDAIISLTCKGVGKEVLTVFAGDGSNIKATLKLTIREQSAELANAYENGFIIDGKGVLLKYNGSSAAVEIPKGVIAIKPYAFMGNENINSVSIPNGVASIGEMAFAWCVYLESVNIPDSVKTIGDEAFMCCYTLSGIDIGNGVTSIGKGAFDDCISLARVTLGKKVKTIGALAFQDAQELETIIIPASVTSVGEGAFSSCPKLTKAVFMNKKTKFYGVGTENPDGVFWARDGVNDYETKTVNVKIYGLDKSTAQKHAEDVGLPFDDVKNPMASPETIAAVEAALLEDGVLPLFVGKSVALKLPDGLKAKDVQFISSDALVAEVSTSGKVKAVGAGVVTITAVKDGEIVATQKYACYVPIKNFKLTYDKNAAKTLNPNQVLEVTVTIEPKNATFPEYSALISSGSDYAVSEKGDGTIVLTCKGVGKATLTIAAEDGSNKKKTLSVTVYDAPEGLVINEKVPSTLVAGKSASITTSITPVKAKTVLKYSTSNADVITVSDKGKIKAVGAGTAVITVETANGVIATKEITVTPKS